MVLVFEVLLSTLRLLFLVLAVGSLARRSEPAHYSAFVLVAQVLWSARSRLLPPDAFAPESPCYTKDGAINLGLVLDVGALDVLDVLAVDLHT